MSGWLSHQGFEDDRIIRGTTKDVWFGQPAIYKVAPDKWTGDPLLETTRVLL